jgi:hypothetical protein
MPDESPLAPASRERPLSNTAIRPRLIEVDAYQAPERRGRPSAALANSFHSIQLSLDAAARWAAHTPVDQEELALALRCAREAADIAWRCLADD